MPSDRGEHCGQLPPGAHRSGTGDGRAHRCAAPHGWGVAEQSAVRIDGAGMQPACGSRPCRSDGAWQCADPAQDAGRFAPRGFPARGVRPVLRCACVYVGREGFVGGDITNCAFFTPFLHIAMLFRTASGSLCDLHSLPGAPVIFSSCSHTLRNFRQSLAVHNISYNIFTLPWIPLPNFRPFCM